MFADRGESCRVTFIRSSSETRQTAFGEAYVFAHDTPSRTTCVAVVTDVAPDWHDESGVSVVAAERDGSVLASFTVADVRTVPAGDGHQDQMHEYRPS